jgi:ADP-ribose pyrophosphatase YjhB (NUDIX family)
MSPLARARALFFDTFYRLPAHWRRRLVRLGTAKFVVGAVVLVREADQAGSGRIVLLRQPPGRAWGLPAGLLKRGEPAEVGAARELFEETGIRVPAEELTACQPSAIVHHDGRWIDAVFEARVPADTPLVADGAEVLEAAWHHLDQLPQLTTPTAQLLAHYGIGPLVESR